jgi:hypothetical protein
MTDFEHSNGKGELLATVVFCDYEYWFWSLYNQYGEKPDVSKVIHQIKKHGKLIDVYFFGDFTSELMQKEREKLRRIANNIIDCASNNKKDYTDFIMLDNIYQTILKRPDIEQYILITGDGHFHSAAAFLKNFVDKPVGVIAVKGSFSEQLKNTASWHYELTPNNPSGQFRPNVLQSIDWAERKGYAPTFGRTIEAGERFHKIDRAKLAVALSGLINDGYIRQEVKKTPKGNDIRVLVVDWDLVKRHGIWKPETYN